ncbi:hypothetical protein HanRHA438_Chr17g0801521 [Helianthus annuus]|nr:hypothetical protein HanIR_Chr17g0858761 [Helianthus annuus]KAJ0825288.1 hypothetical protein HanRHA438_Chr17g0801521 [Helianthus annuus]
MARRNDKCASDISVITENGICKLLQKPSVVVGGGNAYNTSCTYVQKGAVDGSKKLSLSDESFRTVMYLSCWGLN